MPARRLKRVWIAMTCGLVLALAITACDGSSENQTTKQAARWQPVDQSDLSDMQRAQARQALAAKNALFGGLMQALTAALNDGDPAAAIRVCQEKAPAIAQTVATEHRVRIGRTSWKLRNPDNTPPDWAAGLIAERPERTRYLAGPAGALGVLMPIRLAGTCVQCHGPADQLDPAVKAQLAQHYPEDAATGFAEGDLRGWFWVEAPAATIRREPS
jgi:hypothetical protein